MPLCLLTVASLFSNVDPIIWPELPVEMLTSAAEFEVFGRTWCRMFPRATFFTTWFEHWESTVLSAPIDRNSAYKRQAPINNREEAHLGRKRHFSFYRYEFHPKGAENLSTEQGRWESGLQIKRLAGSGDIFMLPFLLLIRIKSGTLWGRVRAHRKTIK